MLPIKILAISGSLRAESSNQTLLRALALVAECDVVLFDGMAGIPAFNPDIEATVQSEDLARFKAAIREADAVVISTPEYAHGMPGALKNALDWIVGTGELSGKPVVLVNASTRGVHAQASLREVVKTMDARLLGDAEVTIDLMGKKLAAEEIAGNAEFAGRLRESLRVISCAIMKA